MTTTADDKAVIDVLAKFDTFLERMLLEDLSPNCNTTPEVFQSILHKYIGRLYLFRNEANKKKPNVEAITNKLQVVGRFQDGHNAEIYDGAAVQAMTKAVLDLVEIYRNTNVKG